MSTTTASSSDSAVDGDSRNWLDLPRDMTATILHKLGAIEVLTSAQKVCVAWRRICQDVSMWRRIDMRNLGDLHHMEYDLEKMCYHAVDRSDGRLIDINVEYFGTDELLHHIADRSDGLKRLRLVSCYGISDEGLIEGAAKLPLLEELDLSLCSFSKEALEAVGRSCSLLKSFKLNSQAYAYPHIECDEEALAIAENMPGLLHLQLFGNKLSDNGLQAILNGCPQLESLDLRRCFNVNLRGNLAKTCEKQIKALRLPNDSTYDYEFDAGIAGDGSLDEDDYPCGFSFIEILAGDDDFDELSSNGGLSDYDYHYHYHSSDYDI